MFALKITFVKTRSSAKEYFILERYFCYLAGPAVKFNKTGTVLRRPPPTLGQHTKEVLQDVLGLDTEQIECLKSKQVIQ